jgi:hypothetical protein
MRPLQQYEMMTLSIGKRKDKKGRSSDAGEMAIIVPADEIYRKILKT